MKKFVETDTWDKSWFDVLTPSQKLAWKLINDKADHAGVVDIPDWALRRYTGGRSLTMARLAALFGPDRLRPIEGGKYWLPGYIPFQHPGGISAIKRPHHPAVLSVIKYALPVLINHASTPTQCRHNAEITFDDSSRIPDCECNSTEREGGDFLGKVYVTDTYQDKDKDKDKESRAHTHAPAREAEEPWRPDPGQFQPVTDEAPRDRYGPPTRDVVEAYAKSQGWPVESATTFWLFHDSKDWSSFNPRNWRSRLEIWVRKDLSEGRVTMPAKKPAPKNLPEEPRGWRTVPEYAGTTMAQKDWPVLLDRERREVIEHMSTHCNGNHA